MNRRKKNLFICALAGLSFAACSPFVAAAPQAQTAGLAATDKAVDSASQEKDAGNKKNIVDKKDSVKDATALSAAKQRAELWNKERPDEKKLESSLAQYDGKTIVSIDVTGLEKLPKSTVMDVLKEQPGSKFTAAQMEKDRTAIYDTGLFYDNYPTFELVPEGVKITYHVMENPVLEKIDVSGNTIFSTKQIDSMLTVKKGEILNTKILRQDISNIEMAYMKEGYILAKLQSMSIDPDGVLKLNFNEGILEGYKVEGNIKTKNKVILREMRMKPGQPFNANLARRSMQRIYNLGFFQDVNMKLLPGKEPNSVILEVIVVEKRTGAFGIGAGYSNNGGFLGSINLSDSNFRGTGDSVGLMYEFGGNDDDDRGFSVNYYHPWLDSKQTSASFRFYNRTYEYDDYDTNGHEIEEYDRHTRGEEITFGRPSNEYTTNYISLKNQDNQYKKYVSGLNRSRDMAWRKKNFGTTRSLSFSHVVDTRDNIYNPTQGHRYSFTAEHAGFGGDFTYNKYMANGQQYYPLGHAHVLALRLNLGYSNKLLPSFSQFQIGGQSTLRGYKDNQFKGSRMVDGSIEYQFPVVSKVRGALFFDYGDAWKGQNWPWQKLEDGFTLHHSYGVGVQIQTPVGPLRLDYGIGSDGGRTNFSIGGTF